MKEEKIMFLMKVNLKETSFVVFENFQEIDRPSMAKYILFDPCYRDCFDVQPQKFKNNTPCVFKLYNPHTVSSA